MPKFSVRMDYFINVPDEEFEDARGAVSEIAEDAQCFIDQYAYEFYCSMVERLGDDE